MQSNELATIAAAVQEALQTAYMLARSDAAHNDNVDPAGIPKRDPHRAASPGSIKGLLLDCRYPLGAKK